MAKLPINTRRSEDKRMAAYVIPLTPEPQSFGITLAGKEYRLTVRWLDTPEAGWFLDIEQPDKAAPIILGLSLVAGQDLLEQYAYLDFGGELRVQGDMPPSLDNLGSEVELLFITEDY